MKFSEQWLREWVNPSVSTRELAEQLTMAGLEVDSIEAAAPAFDGVVVGRVDKVEPHPDADKLRVCQVDVAGDELLNIVCGAPNVYEGMRAPVATVGGRLPGDFKIKKAKLRGVQSFGMLCSAKELGLSEESEGLMELAPDAPVGRDLREHFALDDKIIDMDLTPNRGDCLGMAGVARELGVLNRCAVTEPAVNDVAPLVDERFPVEVDAGDACPRYLGRVVRGVDVSARTPVWMQERLRRGGIRSLGPVVDVTNYVLLEWGQPMHAFDLDQLVGRIRVRYAHQGESITLLDGKEVELDSDTLVIADDEKPLALAGIMGGQGSGVREETRDLLLECAFFDPRVIAGRARRHGLQTDSSFRFERGVDPTRQHLVMERATQLLVDIAGGRPGPVIDVTAEAQLPAPSAVALRASRLQRLLGMDVPGAEVEDIVRRLGAQVVPAEDGWSVTPPAFRFDLELEADFVEEVGRIYGYNRIPSETPVGRLNMQPRSETRVGQFRLRELLADRGYQEVITFSFVDPEDQATIDPDHEPVALANPLSSEMAVMRTSLWPGLLRAAAHNLKRQQEGVRLFELGLRFIKQDDEIKQINTLSGIAAGPAYPEQWGLAGRPLDFFDMKGDVEGLLELTGGGDQFIFEPERHPALHPGQCASIRRSDDAVGWIGALHPELQKKLDFNERVLLFELNSDAVSEAVIPSFTPLSRYPSIRRDLAIVVDEAVSSREVRDCIGRTVPDLLREIRVFDEYRGKGVDSGRKSLALGLILQESSRTLTDQEVDSVIDGVVAELKEKLGAALRD